MLIGLILISIFLTFVALSIGATNWLFIIMEIIIGVAAAIWQEYRRGKKK